MKKKIKKMLIDAIGIMCFFYLFFVFIVLKTPLYLFLVSVCSAYLSLYMAGGDE